MPMLIFPGQGSQQPGMGQFLFDNFKIAKEIYEESSDAINFDLKKLCFNASESELALTENTQPALLVTSTATQRILRQEFGVVPSSAAGHSVGEYAALVAAESITLRDAIKAVRIRGQAMQSAVPVGNGGMSAIIGLEPVQIEELCNYVIKNSKFSPLSPANFNSPGQIVVSGSMKALLWLQENVTPEKVWGDLAPKRMRVIPLQVSAPFHCEMMKPAEDKMREVLSLINLKDAKFPVLQNFTATAESQAEVLRENLIRQVSAPVKWTQSMTEAKSKNWLMAIECGSGKILKGLLSKIDPNFTVLPTNSLEDLKNIAKYLEEAREQNE